MKRIYYIEAGSRSVPVEVEPREGGRLLIRFEERNSTYEFIPIRPGVALVQREDGKLRELYYREEQGKLRIYLEQEEFLLEVLDELEKARRARSGSLQGAGVLKALMPGRVVDVLVQEGDRVREGQGILVLSAMKMENELKSPADGIVRVVYVKKGDVVEAGASLVEVQPLPEESSSS
jgi:biotin carboxyl carrier protein